MKEYCPNDCAICREKGEICFYDKKNLSFKCPVCKEWKSPHDIYEYRGRKCCLDCLTELQKKVDFERQEKLEKDKSVYDKYKGLDFSNSSVGKGNKEIFGIK